MRRNLKKLQLCLLGGALVFGVTFLREEWNLTALCDGFSLVGVLFLGYGGLLFLNARSAFSGVRFIGDRVKSYLFPFLFKKESRSWGEERTARTDEQKAAADLRSVLVIGFGYLAVAVALLFFI